MLKELKELSGMFFHRDVYEHCYNRLRSNKYWKKDYSINSQTLETLGFVSNGIDKSLNNRYYNIYKHHNVDTHVVGVDDRDHYSHIIRIEDKHDVIGVYCPNDFVKAWHKVTGNLMILPFNDYFESAFAPDIKKLIKEYKKSETTELDMEDNDMVEYVNKVVDLYNISLDDAIKRYNGVYSFMKPSFNNTLYHDSLSSFDMLYGTKDKLTSVYQEVLDFLDFKREFYSVNRFFFPTMNGEQCGNQEATLELSKVVTKLMEEELKEREEDED